MIINSGLDGHQACYALFDPKGSLIYLVNDTLNAYIGTLTPGTSTTLQNSQCTITGASSSMTLSGTVLTLNLAVTFGSAFSGAKSVFVHAMDSRYVDTGWTKVGNWTVP
jgi:hypothetical protein